MSTGIQWTDETWNPLAGCTPVSDGCRNCYAAREAVRLAGHPHPKIAAKYAGTAEMRSGRAVFTGRVNVDRATLAKPLRWRKPRRVFVNSMSDLFHESVSNETIAAVFGVMAATPQHTYQVLTKRPERMQKLLNSAEFRGYVDEYLAFEVCYFTGGASAAEAMGGTWEAPQIGDEGRVELPGYFEGIRFALPLSNVWLGVSVEDQATADERIPLLLATPAAVRFVSYEPALGALDLTRVGDEHGDGLFDALGGRMRGCSQSQPRLDWVIAGGESGPNARPAHPDWFRSVRDQCRGADVPFFFKQWGKRAAGRELDGRTWEEMP